MVYTSQSRALCVAEIAIHANLGIVPSAVVPGDFNYLNNPAHKDFSKVKVLETEKFSFDGRLFLK